MITNLKNLKGVKQLSKPEQKNVQGGGQTCRFKIEDGGSTQLFAIPGFANDQLGSSQAESFCIDSIMLNGADRCSYDCEWDGFSTDFFTDGFAPSIV